MSPQPEKPSPVVGTVNRPRERQNEAITKTEFLTDSVRVCFCCRLPWGTSDERSAVDLPYAAISALPVLPTDHGHGEFRETWEESVYIPTGNVTVVFRFAKWQETDDCRMEALVGGPYRTRADAASRVVAA